MLISAPAFPSCQGRALQISWPLVLKKRMVGLGSEFCVEHHRLLLILKRRSAEISSEHSG